ncbi:Platelet endothelial aggregation receptor 1 [Plecturocebus cupreus]
MPGPELRVREEGSVETEKGAAVPALETSSQKEASGHGPFLRYPLRSGWWEDGATPVMPPAVPHPSQTLFPVFRLHIPNAGIPPGHSPAPRPQDPGLSCGQVPPGPRLRSLQAGLQAAPCSAPARAVPALGQASAMSPPLRPLLLLALGLGLAGTLNPSDPNTCSFWESFTTTTKESHSRPFSLLPSEPCERPWEGAHTCPQPTVVYRTVYRQVVKTEHRQRLQCCHGFYESSGFCVPLCAQECVHGRCVAPNQCQCVPGWRGDDCSSECAPGMWGPQCDKPCICGNSSCDPKSGVCACLSGLQPPNCLQPCTPGYYGPACQFRCQCHGAPCDPQTGACFCPAERTGPSCDVSCPQGTAGFFCPSTHPCQNGGVFQAPKGSCSCPPGWMGTICSLPCPEGFHGPNCSQKCRCHNGGLCDRFTGQCRCAPGYTGDRCREECPVGRFGQDCAETCDCGPDARCFPANGACLCEHGFTGDRCTERLCPDGFYGLGCQAPCTCDPEHSLSCHPMNGECSCLPGWAGLHCNESCPQDTHGPGCQEHCLCLHGGVCQAASGLCQCAPGYTGPHCARLCPPDTYGVNCSSRCSCENAIACSPIDGECVCKEGNWMGFPRGKAWGTGGRAREEGRVQEPLLQVGSVVTALCPAHPEPGASVAMPAASVPMRESAAPKLEPVPAPLGGMGPAASCPARRGNLEKVVPVTVTVTTLMAVTRFMDAVSVRLAGWVSILGPQAYGGLRDASHRKCVQKSPLELKGAHPGTPDCCLPQAPAATCPALRAYGESTVATPAPARMGALASLRMATVCVHPDSEAPPARDVRLPTAPSACHQQGAVWCQMPELSLLHPPWSLPLTRLQTSYCSGKEGGRQWVKGGLRVGLCPPITSAPFSQPVSLAATANAVCPASAGTTPPATPRTGRATAWLAGQALTAPSHALQDTGEKTVPSPANVTMVGPAVPRMGAVSAPQAGLDPTACKVALCGHLVLTAPSHASVVLEKSATQRLGPVYVPPGTVARLAGLVSSLPPRFYPLSPGNWDLGIQEPFTVMPTTPVAYNSLGAVIGIAVLGSLVVALVALFIGYRHWQKGKEHHHLAVAYSSGRLDGSEYVMPDVPPSYSHYYSNPSYHTLSQCSPNPPPPNKVPGQLFASLQAPERPGGAHGHDNHATLPADWKHRREHPPGPPDRGSSRLDRSYSYSSGPGPFYHNGLISEEGLGASVASLSSENPYATIRDLPSLPGGPRESSYMEMKGPPSGSPPRQPRRLQLRDSQRDSGTYEQPSPLLHDRDSAGPQPPLPPGQPPGHYDSPKNSHIPGHYDLPPVRHPPSPPLRRQDR